jgi:hypothetical protein
LLRTRDTGYGSDAFARVARNERILAPIEGAGPRAVWRRIGSGSLERAWYRRRLPAVTVQLTDSPAGRMIGEHLAIREGRRWRHRDAQGVLSLPADFADYRRGRHRQAVRTNVNHARKAGLTVTSRTLDTWGPGPGDFRVEYITPGPIERWMAFDPDGRMVGDSILSVDAHVALLHGMVSTVSPARWLLHTVLVERLCGSCELLLVNSAAVYRESYGSHHLQRLLGYQIARLRVPEPLHELTSGPRSSLDRAREQRSPMYVR